MDASNDMHTMPRVSARGFLRIIVTSLKRQPKRRMISLHTGLLQAFPNPDGRTLAKLRVAVDMMRKQVSSRARTSEVPDPDAVTAAE
jgi:hypothetical protein